MKKTLLFTLLFLCSLFAKAQQQTVNYNITPSSFNEGDEITISFLGNSINESTWGITNHALYLWAWSFDLKDENIQDCPSNGSWTSSNELNKLTYNSTTDSYSISFVPSEFFNRNGIGKIGFLIKSKDGTGDKKSQDITKEVGTFQVTLDAPLQNENIVTSGDIFAIAATSSIPANFQLIANGNSVNTQNTITSYNYNYSITQNTDFQLNITEPGTTNTVTYAFSAFVNPSSIEEPVPANMKDGFNYDSSNPNEATFVLYAPDKEFVHLIGNFNNNDWAIDNTYLLKKDSATERFWITVDLSENPVTDLEYQYVVEYNINIADPYSTLILDEYNDQYIESSSYTNIPAYPVGKTSQAVSWVSLTETEYNWQNTSFTPPNKEDLVVYEILIRDFDDDHNYQDVIDRLDYLEDLGINAIELMPVQEFDGNNSWGYNPSFHMALDKFYGTRNDFKRLIDSCHERGIAVIMDVVYNHATGQNPYYRLYNTDNGGTGGSPSADSPFFNQSATHSYSVFNDFNHQSVATKSYVERSSTYWIDEFKIDGFRWDLTKGFTQNCSGSESCTNAYNADRVAVLEEYADMQWAANNDFYIIFEHLGYGGSATEEQEWASYRATEGKGIMLWDKQTETYNEATMGYSNSNISGISYKEKGFNTPKAMGYMESHDEERIMYKNLAFGNSNSDYNVKTENTALARMQAAGAFFFTVPGPKMIWQFGELGYDVSIFTCEDGSLPTPYGSDQCKLSIKPDGWDYLDNPQRRAVYDTWSKLIAYKEKEPIFKTADFSISAAGTNGLKTIHLTNAEAIGTEIKYVTVIGNFGIVAQNINPQFQETGTWFDLIDNSNIEVSSTTALINLQPGEFKVYANEESKLGVNTPQFQSGETLKLYPNPASGFLNLNKAVDHLEIYDLSGKLIHKLNADKGGKNQFNIDFLKQGLYLLKIINSEKIEYLKLVVE